MIDSSESVINSRDVIARIEELEEERGLQCCRQEWTEEQWATEYPDEARELENLQDLHSLCWSHPDWGNNAVLINENIILRQELEELRRLYEKERS